MKLRLMAISAALLLLLLQLYWQFFLPMHLGAASYIGKVLLILPIALVCALFFAGRKSAGFLAGLFCLFYFSHGIMEAWAIASVRTLACLEIILAIAIILLVSWQGMHNKFKLSRRSNV